MFKKLELVDSFPFGHSQLKSLTRVILLEFYFLNFTDDRNTFNFLRNYLTTTLFYIHLQFNLFNIKVFRTSDDFGVQQVPSKSLIGT